MLKAANWRVVAEYLGLAAWIARSGSMDALDQGNDGALEDTNYCINNVILIEGKYRIDNDCGLIEALGHALSWKMVHNVLKTAVEASSQARAAEGPFNTTTKSVCLERARFYGENARLQDLLFAQTECGCIGSGKPCYWASAPALDCAAVEYVTYSLIPQAAFLAAFTITLYRDVKHSTPTVNGPQAVCLQIVERPIAGKNKYCKIQRRSEDELAVNVRYQSEYYPVDNVLREQIFVLPRPVLCVDCCVRLVFKGLWQRHSSETGLPQPCALRISHCAILAAAIETKIGELKVIKDGVDPKMAENGPENTQAIFRIVPNMQPAQTDVKLYDIHELLEASDTKGLCPQFLSDRIPVADLHDNCGAGDEPGQCTIG